jgi:hypothetical protein
MKLAQLLSQKARIKVEVLLGTNIQNFLRKWHYIMTTSFMAV